jgi:hypothetical protein
MRVECPKCGHIQAATEVCEACGIIFAKYREQQQRNAETLPFLEKIRAAATDLGASKVLWLAPAIPADKFAEASKMFGPFPQNELPLVLVMNDNIIFKEYLLVTQNNVYSYANCYITEKAARLPLAEASSAFIKGKLAPALQIANRTILTCDKSWDIEQLGELLRELGALRRKQLGSAAPAEPISWTILGKSQILAKELVAEQREIEKTFTEQKPFGSWSIILSATPLGFIVFIIITTVCMWVFKEFFEFTTGSGQVGKATTKAQGLLNILNVLIILISIPFTFVIGIIMFVVSFAMPSFLPALIIAKNNTDNPKLKALAFVAGLLGFIGVHLACYLLGPQGAPLPSFRDASEWGMFKLMAYYNGSIGWKIFALACAMGGTIWGALEASKFSAPLAENASDAAASSNGQPAPD